MATSFEYARQARTYDATRAASPSVLAPLRAGLGAVGGGRLLDVGGGTGNYAVALGDDGWRPVVVDRSADMLATAAAKGLATCRADAAALPAADASVDAVTLISMLHHVPDWRDALAEARRVVRPGGVVAFLGFAREHLEAHGVERYFPTTMAHFAAGHQTRAELLEALPGAVERPVFYTDVVDGSLAALARRPELLLDADVRRQTSFVEWAATNCPDELDHGTEELAADLAVGLRPQDDRPELRLAIGDALVLAWHRPDDDA
ncbi:MAG TPA: class I SAM-dependent methyltransferase [Aquihabitans sp.]|jgi:SAM-dependent methyltransferase|nr:class I SAM-dependent methyltransferase [Aquihabitans sp.]